MKTRHRRNRGPESVGSRLYVDVRGESICMTSISCHVIRSSNRSQPFPLSKQIYVYDIIENASNYLVRISEFNASKLDLVSYHLDQVLLNSYQRQGKVETSLCGRKSVLQGRWCSRRWHTWGMSVLCWSINSAFECQFDRHRDSGQEVDRLGNSWFRSSFLSTEIRSQVSHNGNFNTRLLSNG